MIFIDRSVPRSIAESLKKVRRDIYWLDDVWIFHKGTKDTEWLPCIGAANWLAISRDKKIPRSSNHVGGVFIADFVS